MRSLKSLASLVVAAFFVLAGAACAQEPREGREYTVISPAQPTDARGKIEITEFFWYGCPHCYDLEPALQAWLKTLPRDVVFRRVHALFPGNKWLADAKTYYALEAMGLTEKLHTAVFDAIHKERLRMNDEATLFAWMEQKGVDRKKFADTYNSFTVQSKTQRAMQLSQGFRLDGVPALAINGKYVTSPYAADGNEKMLLVADRLIAKARSEQGRK